MSNRTDQTSITDSRLDRELIFTNEDHYLQQRREEEERDRQRAVAQSQHNEKIFAATPFEPDTPIPSVDIPPEEAELKREDLKEPAAEAEAEADTLSMWPSSTAARGSSEAATIDPDVDPENLDKQRLTLRNLDTGEEFIIGENDPDFEFDTFELSYGEFSSDDEETKTATAATNRQSQQQNLSKAMKDTGLVGGGAPHATPDKDTMPKKGKKSSWWKRLLDFLSLKNGDSSGVAGKGRDDNIRERGGSFAAARTPFSKLSSFRFRRELGRGAFGRVLLAEAKTDGSLYALKIISKKNMRQSDKKQAKTERDILLAMGSDNPHPFTTSLKFAFQSENNLYLGMPFIPGGTLRELIKRYGCLPEEWACLYSAELVLAISHMHSLKMLYRDIKPHNVMIDGRGHITIIDFGLSKQDISTAKGAMSLVGTPDYSAPEVLKTGVHQIEANKAKAREEKDNKRAGKKHKDDAKSQEAEKRREEEAANVGYGKAADWWSLGVMVYEMLSGTPAFRGTDLRHTYQRVLFSELIFAPEEKFSPEAKTLLNGLLCRDPSKRLGAEENPPRDIMNSAFFAPISWEKVFACQSKGPWVPEVPRSERRRVERDSRKNESEGRESDDKKKKRSNKKTDGGKEGPSTPASEFTERTVSTDNATPICPTDPNSPTRKSSHIESGFTLVNKGLGIIGEGEGSVGGSYSNSSNPDKGAMGTAAFESDRGRRRSSEKELEMDECSSPSSRTSSQESSNSHSSRSVDSVEGEIHLRDSIFQHSKAANQQNRLQDWSFFDEKMLLSASKTNLPAPDSEGNVPPSPMSLSGSAVPPRAASTDTTSASPLQKSPDKSSSKSKSKSKNKDKANKSNGATGAPTTLTSAK